MTQENNVLIRESYRDYDNKTSINTHSTRQYIVIINGKPSGYLVGIDRNTDIVGKPFEFEKPITTSYVGITPIYNVSEEQSSSKSWKQAEDVLCECVKETLSAYLASPSVEIGQPLSIEDIRLFVDAKPMFDIAYNSSIEMG